MNRTPPECHSLLTVLADHEIDYVLVGSVAVQAWGADVDVPGDLDIVPAMDPLNLQKLANGLASINAVAIPVSGEWITADDGYQWREFDADDPRHDTRLVPNPAVPSSFDSLFTTTFGSLDVVPVISGRFEELEPRSMRLTVCGIESVRVMGVADLLERLTVPRRAKDAPRVAHLRAVQRRQK